MSDKPEEPEFSIDLVDELACELAENRERVRRLEKDIAAATDSEIQKRLDEATRQIEILQRSKTAAETLRDQSIPQELRAAHTAAQKAITKGIEALKALIHRAPLSAVEKGLDIEIDAGLRLAVAPVRSVPRWDTEGFLAYPAARALFYEETPVVTDKPEVNTVLLELLYQEGQLPEDLHGLRTEVPSATPRVSAYDPTETSKKKPRGAA